MRERLQRLAEFDIVSRWSARVPAGVLQLMLGVACVGAFIVIRTVIDSIVLGAGPYAPIYPLVLIATMFGRWRAGVVAYIGSFAWVWLVVLPQTRTATPSPIDSPRIFVSAATVLIVLIFAEVFRRAVREAVAERESAIATLRDREADLRRLNLDLENQVMARTRELARTWEVSPDLLCTSNGDGVLDTSNPAWLSVLGWSPAEIRSTRIAEFVHPDDIGLVDQSWEKMREQGAVTRLEVRLRRKDNSWAYVSWVIVAQGNKLYGSGRDISAEKTAAAELASTQEALRQSQKLEAIGQLTGGVAHDFNNLLTVIRGSVELLKRPGLTDEKRVRYIDAIGDTADRAAKLTGQLLAFARRQTLKPETFDVGVGIEEVAEIVRTLVGSGIEVATNVRKEEWFVSADRSQFDTAIINMAVNARDAMAGGGRLAIEVAPVSGIPALRGHEATDGEYVAIRISDTGSGIPPELLARVFEPFFTTKEEGKGTGLGLSQVIGFAKQSGGDVQVEGRPDAGTTFTMFMPRSEPALAQVSRQSIQGIADGHGTCVLVVEDNHRVGQFAIDALRELGYDSVLATNGEEALEKLAQGGQFQIVFSDVVMPGMSGLELAEAIGQRHSNLPVILASGYSHVLAEEGAHGFDLLQKPYSMEQLSQAFDRARKRHAA